MPWRDVSVMDQRREFVRLALLEGANRRELCRRFGIPAKTGYKWINRFKAGDASCADRSRRPAASPSRIGAASEARVLAVRDAHPAWGARKIDECLRREGEDRPAISTIHRVLSRNGRIAPPPGGGAASLRFEKSAPNQLWQMDFKGWKPLTEGGRCHPLVLIDDHSRFAPGLKACARECGDTVKGHLIEVFRAHGLPDAVFVDNGNPWGDSGGGRWTRFSVWLLKLGVDVIHSRPYHPESRGKVERFNRTLNVELFALRNFRTIRHAQRDFDLWRDIYNHERPHEALGQKTPASRYRPSQRAMPSRLPTIAYDSADIVRRAAAAKPVISFKGRCWRVPKAFRGEWLAIRPRGEDGLFGIFFASRQIGAIDLTKPSDRREK